ncbi:MAG: helix-turn-helix transcriptional regulator [Bacilli bacterium]|jgi:transcriptional regulator with XRE-family HTH domain
MENISKVIANNLIFLRRKHNLTQQELAEKINYSDNAVSRWERGEATPSVETLALIADYFALNVADLLDENFPAKNAPKQKGKRVQRIFVILFSVSIVWTFALIGFIYTQMFKISLGNYGENGWLLFVMSVPISCLVLYFYNKLWGNKVYHLIIFSVFWWSIITTIYLHILVLTGVNLWLIFLLGIPFELAQVLWFFIRR